MKKLNKYLKMSLFKHNIFKVKNYESSLKRS